MSQSPKLPKSKITQFQAQIWAFYAHSGRKMPWRNTRNAYKILVSEIMLQQTQVSRVLEKYPEFLKRFPDIESLAKSPLSDVLHVWQGMGYNRRALALKRMAEKIVTEHKGKIPRSRTELELLPGVGPYTAGAVRAFAFNEAEVFIETNIRRAFIHHFFTRRREVSDQEILSLVQKMLDTKNPREWYYALMDYGAHLPKITKTNSNKQSKHYLKQSTFKGSLRELRGKIIRGLNGEASTLPSIKKISNDDPRTKEVLEVLKKEGLIKYEKRKYQLA